MAAQLWRVSARVSRLTSVSWSNRSSLHPVISVEPDGEIVIMSTATFAVPRTGIRFQQRAIFGFFQPQFRAARLAKMRQPGGQHAAAHRLGDVRKRAEIGGFIEIRIDEIFSVRARIVADGIRRGGIVARNGAFGRFLGARGHGSVSRDPAGERKTSLHC